VEKTYVNSCKRAAGLKIIRDVLKLDLPETPHNDLVNWLCSSLRNSKNQLVHYLESTKGQGTHLENQSRRFFFDVLAGLVQKLRTSKSES